MARIQTIIKTYLELTKPRVVLLLLFTMLIALVIAADGTPDGGTTLISLIGGALAATGASTLNHYFDRDIDARMNRTARRPIPSGRIKAGHALAFGIVQVVLSVVIFAVGTNLLTAVLALIGVLYYVGLYTLLLKRNTSVNIIIGGGAGAMPVLIGWSAVTGSLTIEALVLFLIIFYWTPPHSWALALLVNADYARAGVPMMPVAYGEATTRRQIVLYSVLLVVMTLLPIPLNMLGGLYVIAAVVLGFGLIALSIHLLRRADKAVARRVYKYSTAYLAVLFLVMLVDTWLF